MKIGKIKMKSKLTAKSKTGVKPVDEIVYNFSM